MTEEQKDAVIIEATQALMFKLGRRPVDMSAYLHPADLADLMRQVYSLQRAFSSAPSAPPQALGSDLKMETPLGTVTIKADPTMPEGSAKLCSPLYDGAVAEVAFAFNIDTAKSVEVSEDSFASAFQNFVDGSQASDVAQPYSRMKVTVRRRVDIAIEAMKRGQKGKLDMLKAIAEKGSSLSTWEREFMESIGQQIQDGYDLTEKQEKVLKDIYERIGR